MHGARNVRVSLLYMALLLAFSASCTAKSGAVSTAIHAEDSRTDNAQQRKHGNRFLRTEKAAHTDASKVDEERATLVFNERLVDKVQTSRYLNLLLDLNTSLNLAQSRLLGSVKSVEEMVNHWNWKAYTKYVRMMWERDTGAKLPYARIGSRYLTKKETQKVLIMLLALDASMDYVREYLGLRGMKQVDQALHTNWRALELYRKWHNDYRRGSKDVPFAKFGTGYHSESKAKQTLLSWALQGTKINDVLTTLGLAGLSEKQIENHFNYEALLTYLEYYMKLAVLRAQRAAANNRVIECKGCHEKL